MPAYTVKTRCGSDTYVKRDGKTGAGGKGALVGEEVRIVAMPRKQDEEKYCEKCGKMLHRQRMANGKLESNFHFHRRKYCDRKCMAASFEEKPKKDSPSWMTAHYHARKVCPPGPCEVCGKDKRTEVHHRNGDWQDNRPENLMRICRSCHMKEHNPKGTCRVCGKPQKGLGLCEKHYQRFKKYGDPLMTAYGPRP